jgi:hypothetical protein
MHVQYGFLYLILTRYKFTVSIGRTMRLCFCDCARIAKEEHPPPYPSSTNTAGDVYYLSYLLVFLPSVCQLVALPALSSSFAWGGAVPNTANKHSLL